MISHAICSLLSPHMKQTFPAVRQEGHCPARISLLRRTSHALGVGPVCHSSSLSQGVVLCWDARAKRGTTQAQAVSLQLPSSSQERPNTSLLLGHQQLADRSSWRLSLFQNQTPPPPSSYNQQPQTDRGGEAFSFIAPNMTTLVTWREPQNPLSY